MKKKKRIERVLNDGPNGVPGQDEIVENPAGNKVGVNARKRLGKWLKSSPVDGTSGENQPIREGDAWRSCRCRPGNPDAL